MEGLTQQLVAGYLDTKQANLAMIEKGKFKPALRYLEALAKLFGISKDWLEKGESPVFNYNVNIYTLPPNPYLPRKTKNEIDNAIRTSFHTFMQDEKISDIHLFEVTEVPPEQAGNFSIFIYHSKELRHLNIFKTREYKDQQFYESLNHINNKALLETYIHKRPFYFIYNFLMVDSVPDNAVAEFESMLGYLMLKDEDKYYYIKGFRALQDMTQRYGFLAFSPQATFDEIMRIVRRDKYITVEKVEEIERCLKKFF